MKAKLYLLMILGFVIFSCRDVYKTFTVKNATKYDLVIYGYRMGIGHISFAEAVPIYMDPFSKIQFKRSAGEGFDSRTFFSVTSVDSVEIIFNEERKLVLSRHEYPCPECHTILQDFEIATITEEDYNNAVPINE